MRENANLGSESLQTWKRLGIFGGTYGFIRINIQRNESIVRGHYSNLHLLSQRERLASCTGIQRSVGFRMAEQEKKKSSRYDLAGFAFEFEERRAGRSEIDDFGDENFYLFLLAVVNCESTNQLLCGEGKITRRHRPYGFIRWLAGPGVLEPAQFAYRSIDLET